jgi:uncharacterized membrane protein YkoI
MRKTFPTYGKIALLAAALATGGAAVASAGQRSEEGKENQAEVQTFLGAPQTLTEAVAKAERETGGRAMDASFEVAKDKTAVYEVELIKPDGSQVTAMVDQSGAVKLRATDEDHDDDGEHEDDDND